MNSVNEDVVLAQCVVSEVMDTLLADADACTDPPERSLCSSAETVKSVRRNKRS